MDQGVLECIKSKYCRKLLGRIFDGGDLREELKKIDLLDVVRVSES